MTKSTIELPILRPLADGDIDAVHGLSVEVRWPHRPDDWRLVLEIGDGIVAADDGGRVMASAMWFPFGPSLAAIGMVIVSPRLQGKGTGRRMMRQIFEAAGDRTLRLVATAAGQRLYESEGFSASATINQYQGIASSVATMQDSRLRPADEGDWGAIAALDSGATGGDRSKMLDALQRVGKTFVIVKKGKVIGFSICRPFGRGHVVGPLVSENAQDAVALASPHVQAHAGGFLRMDTPEREGPFIDFIEASGLANVDRVLQMTRGTLPKTGPAKTFTLTNQALG